MLENVVAMSTSTSSQHQPASDFPPVVEGVGANCSVASMTSPVMSIAPLDRSHLYDLAQSLLSGLVPGWDEVDDDEDLLDGEEQEPVLSDYILDAATTTSSSAHDGLSWMADDDAVMDAVEDMDFAGVDVGAALAVDASYRACILEAERYLVQYEGFAPDDGVLSGLRQHLHLARVRATEHVKQAGDLGDHQQTRHRRRHGYQ